MGKKKRIITSFSDVITNSSTQVFFLDIEEKLINLLNENNITDKVIIINSKEADILWENGYNSYRE